MADGKIKFIVKVSEDLEFEVELDKEQTVKDLKLVTVERSGVTLDEMKYILKGIILKDE